MKFVDSVRIRVMAGDGGSGSIAFRRESFMPFGGPAGGDGGKGGSVILVAEEGRTSLLDLAHMPALKAQRGEHGRGKDQYGKGGKDLTIGVPIGTQVYDFQTGELIGDLTENGSTMIVAQGGAGGRGNIHFSSSYDRAPRRAEPGTPGEDRMLRLELKVLADVGLLGFPNVGKSTLVATMSAARPKIADYPFTTLQPHLGVVHIGGRASKADFVLADIPGLVPGASEGIGLGTRFLKHVERCRVLLHLLMPPIDPLLGEGRDPMSDFDAIMKELAQFAPELAKRPMIVAMSKGDLPEAREIFPEWQARFAKRGIRLRLISAATRDGLEQLARDLYHAVRGRLPEADDAEMEPGPPAPLPLPQPKAAPKPAAKKPAAKKAPAKKAVAKKKAAKKPAAKKAPAKKAVAKKKAAKKPAAKKAPAKKAVAKKKPGKKVVAKKSLAKKPAVKHAPAKRAAKKPAKKPAKRAVASRAAPKKQAKPAVRRAKAKLSRGPGRKKTAKR
jgi:GTP-binding protein